MIFGPRTVDALKYLDATLLGCCNKDVKEVIKRNRSQLVIISRFTKTKDRGFQMSNTC